MYIHRWCDPLCRKSPEIRKDTLELINKISKTAQYKINIQNSTVFLYTRNKQSKNDVKETIPFTIASKRIKCLGINLTKELQDLKDCNLPNNAEREVKEALNEWRNSPCSWTGRLNIAKMAILYKLINKSNVIPIKSH